jgi:RimJ/RimL family protein N-acetyltransferase
MNVGPAFDFEPVLEGSIVRLRPMRANEFESLYAVASDPLIWAQHPAKERAQRGPFETWFNAARTQHALTVEELASGRVIGSSRYYDWDAERYEVAIGFTFLARDHWGGTTNAEMKQLMLNHAFKWARTIWFHVDPANVRSRKAVEKIGGVFSHIAMLGIYGAPPRDYVFYRIDAP